MSNEGTLEPAQQIAADAAAPCDVILSDNDVVQPDLLFVSHEREHLLSSSQNVRGAPDLVIEILSPSTAEKDRGYKRTLYAKHGVAEYWLVDPVAETIQIQRQRAGALTPTDTFGRGDTLDLPMLPLRARIGMEAGMRAVVVAVVVGVVFPGVALAQLAPASQAEFEQRFTGWTLLSDAPDCNEGNGLDPVTFIGPGRFETNGLEGDYQYRGTGADTGTLTLTVDILPIPQVSDLTFDSRTTGTFAAGAGGVVLCEGGFELVDSTIPDTTPPSLVGAEVAVSGDEMALAFDEELAGVDSLHDLLASALSVTADGEPVPVDGYAYGDFGRIGRRLQLFLSSVITRGQTVVVSYADPTPGDDDVALQDLAGNDLASFTATATNNSAVEPVPALPLTGAGLLGLLLILLGGRRRPSG